MKKPDEIKKGLARCALEGESASCRTCPYENFGNGSRCIPKLTGDALAYIRQLEEREWDLFDLLSSAWHGKQYYSKQEDGSVYSRESCEYLTFDQAIDEFAHSLTVARDINVPTQPKWISVEERLPEESSCVLCVIKTGWGPAVTEGYFWKGDQYISPIDEDYSFEDVTHWMPRPSPGAVHI